MRGIAIDFLTPVIYFKGFKDKDWFNKNSDINNQERKGKRILKNFFSDIDLPNNIYYTLFVKREYLELPIPIPQPFDFYKIKCYIREPHYYYFFEKYRPDLYFDTKNIQLTESEFTNYKSAFLSGFFDGSFKYAKEHLKQTLVDNSNYSLIETILQFPIASTSEDKYAFSFKFLLDPDWLYCQGIVFGKFYRFFEMLEKVEVSERNKVIDKIYLHKATAFYENIDPLAFTCDDFLFQIENSIKTKKKNIFNNMPLEDAFFFFEKLKKESNSKGDRLIHDSQIYLFFKRAFLGEMARPLYMNIPTERGNKEIIYNFFYNYYEKCKINYEPTVQCKEKYVKLLTDNFIDFNFDIVNRNFRK